MAPHGCHNTLSALPFLLTDLLPHAGSPHLTGEHLPSEAPGLMTGGGPLLKPVSMYSRPPPLLPPLTPCVQGRTQPHFLSPRGARACFLEAVLTFFLALCSACSWCEACCRHRASSLCSCLSGCAPRLTLRAAGGRPTSGLCRRCLPASEGKAGKRFESWHRKKKTTH